MMKEIKVCDVCGITSASKKITYMSSCKMSLCDKHIAQMKKYHKITDPTSRTVKDKNEIIEHEDYAEIIIRNKRNEVVAAAMIDLEDVSKVKLRKWNVLPCRNSTYIYTKTPKHTKLHRYILDYYGPKDIDHINRNPLDNRKSNLRIVTRSENASNTNAKHIKKSGNKWRYEIVRFGKRFQQSGFSTYEDAYQALQKCISDVSGRVNELIDQFNEQMEINPFKGVYLHYGKYQAVYYHKGKKYYAGTHATPEEAYKARTELINKLHFE